jgi:SAM-dependent MidA family methyltransferase
MSIKERLISRIGEKGLITYEAFLEIVLYDEGQGYYRAGKADRKDYQTSPEISPLFGRTIGRYIETLCDLLGVRSLNILEPGGASGRLAGQIMSALTRTTVKRYIIIDKGTERKEGVLECVNTFDHLEPLDDTMTFVVANEFFDALPFHRIQNRRETLYEIYVGHEEGFFEQMGPLSDTLQAFLGRYPIFLQEGQTLEVTAYGRPFIEKLSSVVHRGCLLVFDYGYHQAEIAGGRFFDGSLLGYKNRQIRDDLYTDLGEMDITHHVNLDHLSTMFADAGWRKEGETEQSRFLQRVGIMDLLAAASREERMSATWLINPEGLGSMISVLAFSKGTPTAMPGFRSDRA